MMKTNNALRLLAMLFVVTGLVLFSGCSDDDEPDCDELTWYADTDSDGLGDPNSTELACDQPTGFVANSDDDDDTTPYVEPTETLAQIIAGNTNLSTLSEFVNADEDLKAIIEGTTAHTVFLPNDDAFTKLLATLGAEDFSQIRADIVAIVLRFHFVVGEHLTASFSPTGPLTTLQTEQIAFGVTTEDETVITTGGSDTEVIILEGDIRATNGVGHIVETILIPPSVFATIGANLGKLSQPVLLTSAFSEIGDLVALADTEVPDGSLSIAQILASSAQGVNEESKYTAFLPANEVLAGVAALQGIDVATLIGSIAPDAASARGFLLNHITEGQILGSDLPQDAGGAGSAITMLTGLSLTPINVGVSESVPSGFVLAVDPTDQSTYIPLFAVDAYKAIIPDPADTDPSDGQDVIELPGAVNGSLHVAAPITASPGGS